MPRPQGDLQLAIGYWIVSHKSALKRWWEVSMMVVTAGSVVWSAVYLSLFFRTRSSTDELLRQAAGHLSRLTAGVEQPRDLVPALATMLERDRQHVDLVARLENPNLNWGAVNVVYHWQLGAQSTVPEKAFVNPGTTRPVISLNIAVPSRPSSASLILDDVEWTRVGSASLPPANFVTEAVTLTPTTITIAGKSIATINLQATVTNRSVYNYYRVAVPVIVLAGDQIVAADLLNLERWPTLTTRTVSSSWSYPVSGATRAEIEPQVSQFAPDNIYR